MLKPTRNALARMKVILASSSPRRREILLKLGIDAEVVPSTFNEDLDRSNYDNHGFYVIDLARHKVREVYERLKDNIPRPDLVIGADTIVTLGNDIYGKPTDKADAFHKLTRLKNREHVVYTGVCLKTPEMEIIFYESTKVKFGDLSDEQICEYIETGEPFDKAGGYGVQGVGACLVEKIDGDFYTVMGIPLYRLTKELNDLFSTAV